MNPSLLIYDQDSVSSSQLETVAKQLGFLPHVVGDLNDAIGAAKEYQPAIIVADLLMEDAIGFIWQARNVIKRGTIPALVLAHRPLATAEHRQIYELQAELLTKPITPTRFTSMMYQLLSTLAT